VPCKRDFVQDPLDYYCIGDFGQDLLDCYCIGGVCHARGHYLTAADPVPGPWRLCYTDDCWRYAASG
jgi:hypothetical protein